MSFTLYHSIIIHNPVSFVDGITIQGPEGLRSINSCAKNGLVCQPDIIPAAGKHKRLKLPKLLPVLNFPTANTKGYCDCPAWLNGYGNILNYLGCFRQHLSLLGPTLSEVHSVFKVARNPASLKTAASSNII